MKRSYSRQRGVFLSFLERLHSGSRPEEDTPIAHRLTVEAFRKQRGKVFNGVCVLTTRTPRNLKDKNFNMSHKLRIFHGLLEKLRQD